MYLFIRMTSRFECRTLSQQKKQYGGPFTLCPLDPLVQRPIPRLEQLRRGKFNFKLLNRAPFHLVLPPISETRYNETFLKKEK